MTNPDTRIVNYEKYPCGFFVVFLKPLSSNTEYYVQNRFQCLVMKLSQFLKQTVRRKVSQRVFGFICTRTFSSVESGFSHKNGFSLQVICVHYKTVFR